jgi:putative Mn2+ efflux pump MntP
LFLAVALSILLLALALSADGLVVGFSFGLRGVKVPALCMVLTCGISAVVFLAAALLGVGISGVIGGPPAKAAGAMILAARGVWMMWAAMRDGRGTAQKARRAGRERPSAVERERPNAVLPAGTVVAARSAPAVSLPWHVVADPERADLDRSGVISVYEALFLGLALALDAGGAGVGASMAGPMPWWSCLVIAVANGGFLWAGVRLGRAALGGLAWAMAERKDGVARAAWLSQGATLGPGLALVGVAVLNVIM